MRGISTSHSNKTFLAIVVALALGILSGCGGADQKSTGGGQSAASTAATPAATGDAGGATAPEGTDLAPVDVELDDGGFASSTPPEYHVPSGFLVLITAKNTSGAKIRLSVSAPSLAQTFKIGPGKTQTITLASISAGKSAKMISGGKTIKIVADAEPGP